MQQRCEDAADLRNGNGRRDFFSPAWVPLLREEPGGDQRERLMMMPAWPTCEPRNQPSRLRSCLAAGTLRRDARPCLKLREFGQGRFVRGVGQVVVVLQRLPPLDARGTVPPPRFRGNLLRGAVLACSHANFHGLD